MFSGVLYYEVVNFVPNYYDLIESPPESGVSKSSLWFGVLETEEVAEIGVGAVFFAAAIFAALTWIQAIYAQRPEGWRRLVIVGSLLLGSLVGLINLAAYGDFEDFVGAFLVGFVMVSVFMMLGKWVYDGFRANKE